MSTAMSTDTPDTTVDTESVYLATTSYRVFSKPGGFHIEHCCGKAGDLSYPHGAQAIFTSGSLSRTLSGPLPLMLEQAAALLEGNA